MTDRTFVEFLAMFHIFLFSTFFVEHLDLPLTVIKYKKRSLKFRISLLRREVLSEDPKIFRHKALLVPNGSKFMETKYFYLFKSIV